MNRTIEHVGLGQSMANVLAGSTRLDSLPAKD